MKTINKHDKIKILNVNESNMFTECKIRFFDSQINTVEFMIQRFCEVIPVNKIH